MGTRKPRICEICGQTYTPNYRDQRTCGRVCGTKIHRLNVDSDLRRKKWPSHPVYIKQCVVCDAWFTSRKKRKIWACSSVCSQREYNRRRPGAGRRYPCASCGQGEFRGPHYKCKDCQAEVRRQRKRRERNRTRGIQSESYTLAEIASRDRYRCGLCGRKVRMDRAVPHAKAPTIDHILPIAEGGDDTRANVQLAHFLCNSAKGVRGSQQLRLTG